MVRLRWIETYNAAQNEQSFFLLALFMQVFERIFIRANREFSIGILQQVPEAIFLFPGRVGVTGKFFVGQAGSSRVAPGPLPFEQVAHEPDGLSSFIKR